MVDSIRCRARDRVRAAVHGDARALEGLDLVASQLEKAIEAVEHQDSELAELVVASDDVIDGRYLEVNQEILTLLATQAPVATDLRLISALLHVLHSFERMGDQCVNICKVIPLTGHDAPQRQDMVDRIVRMGKQARSMVSQAKKAFEARDVALARQPDVAVVVADAAQQPQALALARELRAAGLEVAMDLDGKSLRSQVRAADKSGAAYAAILGEDEVARGEVTLRRLLDGEQSSVSRAQIVATLCEALR